MKYLSSIPGENPVSTYLSNIKRYENKRFSGWTHNRMTYDFGLEPRMMNDNNLVQNYVEDLTHQFDLVMISERFVLNS